jgi:hypothetical protein
MGNRSSCILSECVAREKIDDLEMYEAVDALMSHPALSAAQVKEWARALFSRHGKRPLDEQFQIDIVLPRIYEYQFSRVCLRRWPHYLPFVAPLQSAPWLLEWCVALDAPGLILYHLLRRGYCPFELPSTLRPFFVSDRWAQPAKEAIDGIEAELAYHATRRWARLQRVLQNPEGEQDEAEAVAFIRTRFPWPDEIHISADLRLEEVVGILRSERVGGLFDHWRTGHVEGGAAVAKHARVLLDAATGYKDTHDHTAGPESKEVECILHTLW